MKKLLLFIVLIMSLTARGQMQILTANELRTTLTGREQDFVPFGDTNKAGSKGGIYILCYDCFNAVDDSMTTLVTPYLVDPTNFPDLHYVWILKRQLSYMVPQNISVTPYLTSSGTSTKVIGINPDSVMTTYAANSAISTMQSGIDSKVPKSTTLNINGVSQDMSTNRTFNVKTVASSLFSVISANALRLAITMSDATIITSNDITIPSPSLSDTIITRPINSTVYQINSTKRSYATYAVNIAMTNVLSATSSGYVYLEQSANGTTGWTEVNSTGASTNILSSPSNRQTVCGYIKPGYYVRLRQVATPGGLSTVTITYQSGQEVIFN